MSRIIIARFDSLLDAASAAHALVGDGLGEDAVGVFRAADRRVERWPGHQVYTAIVRIAALGTAGAAVAAAVSALWAVSDVYAVAGAALGALAGSLAGTILTRMERRSTEEGSLPMPAAFVAVVAEPGEESKSAQLLRDAGGRKLERLRGRYVFPGTLHDGHGFDDTLRTGMPIL